jgi:fucose 4-O-acetylase-like acetyltransferase
MNRLISQKFRFYSFMCIVLLLFVHGYNLKVTYLQPYTLVKEPLTFTTFLEYFLANGILRFRLPMLFIITGYIFALQDNKPYGQRIKKRFFTLLVPYLIWSAIAIGFTFLLQQFPVTARAVQDSQIDQLGDYKPYTEIGWKGILYRWIRWTPAFQLWFIRSLFFYNLLYPVFRWAVVKFPIPFFILLFIGWIRFFNFSPFEGQGMLFYAVGIWLCKTNYPIHKKPEWYGAFPAWVLFIGLCVAKTFMAFEFEAHTPFTNFVFSLLYVSSAAAGVLAVWYSGDALVTAAMQKKWVTWLVAFSFVIFAFHVPLLPYMTRLFYMYLNGLAHYRLVTYLIVPVIVFSICVAFGATFRKLAPRLYRIATGGRGF